MGADSLGGAVWGHYEVLLYRLPFSQSDNQVKENDRGIDDNVADGQPEIFGGFFQLPPTNA